MSNTIVTAPRASTLIYGLVRGRSKGVWLLPANVCPAIPLILVEAKVTFEFIDINHQSLCIDIDLVKARVLDSQLPLIEGVIYVRSYGCSTTADKDLKELRKLLGLNALIIDDQCLGFPVLEWEEQQYYGADVAIFSTGYSKIFDLGSGGYGIFFSPQNYAPPNKPRDSQVFESIMQGYKIAIANDQPLFGGGSLPNTLPRWVAGGKGPSWSNLKHELENRWKETLRHKEKLNAIYREALQDFSPLSDDFQNWRFNIRVENPKMVLQSLFAEDLFASDHYYPSSRLWGNRGMPISTEIHKTIVNLFNDGNFTIMQAKQTAQIIQKVALRV